MKLRDFVMTPEKALATLSLLAPTGVLKVEDKLGGNRHEARLVSKAAKDTTPLESAIKYIIDSPAQVFAVNVTTQGTRGRSKVNVPDKMFVAFYTKAQILKGVKDFGPTFTIHTNCVTFHSVTELSHAKTFGMPLCAVECPFALKDVPRDDTRPQAPYAKAWETFLSTLFHGHNVANLNNSRYDMRLEFINDGD